MMHEQRCADVRDRLEALHDGELAVEERIAVQNHLAECVACSVTADELAALGSGLRDLAAHIAEHDTADPSRVSAQVFERFRVEEQFSIRAQVTGWFQDMHLVWAGLGATAATLICVAGSASVLHATSQERPNSMARTIAVLASPGSNDNPMRLNYEMLVAPKDDARPLAVMASPIEMTEEEAEYALSAVVSREGRVQGVAMINQPQAAATHRSVNAILNEAYRVQFAPALDRGDAVAVSMVWLVSNTTVKGRPIEMMEVLREAMRIRNSPEPLRALPVPAEAIEPKPAPLLKPLGPDISAAMALAATAGGN